MYWMCATELFAIHTHTHNTQPFYGSVEFVRENPGEPVPEEHSPTTLIVVIIAIHACIFNVRLQSTVHSLRQLNLNQNLGFLPQTYRH